MLTRAGPDLAMAITVPYPTSSATSVDLFCSEKRRDDSSTPNAMCTQQAGTYRILSCVAGVVGGPQGSATV